MNDYLFPLEAMIITAHLTKKRRDFITKQRLIVAPQVSFHHDVAILKNDSTGWTVNVEKTTQQSRVNNPSDH